MKKIFVCIISAAIALVNCSCNINDLNFINKHKLRSAICFRNFEAVKEAVQSNEDVNALKWYTEVTPFSLKDNNPAAIAYAYGDYKIAEYLIKNGSNPNYYGDENATYLMFETKNLLRYDFMDSLLSNGADINYKTPDGDTAMKFFLSSDCWDDFKGFNDMFNHLVENGADYKSALKYYDISDCTNYNFIKFIFDFATENNIKLKLDDMLLYTLNGDNQNYLKAIESGKYLSTDKTKLAFFTVAFGSKEMVQALNQKENISDLIDTNGNSLAFAAAVNDDIDVGKFVLNELKVKTNRINYSELNDLSFSLALGNTEYAKYLLNKGSKIQINQWLISGNEEDVDIPTTDALAVAILNEQYDSVDFLVKNGYPVKNLELVFDAIILAINSDDVEMIDYFIKNNLCSINISSKINEENLLIHSCEYNASECVKYLLENNVDLSYVFDENPLCSAVRNYNYEITKMLIDGGMDINRADSEGFTPLMNAVDVGDLEIIKLLVANGADVDYVNEEGYGVVTIAETEVSKNIYDYINSL